MPTNKELTEPWSMWKCITFRFLFVFFFLKTSFWSFIPGVGSALYQYYYYPSFFVQNYILNLHETPIWRHTPTGSGDTLDDWMLNVAYLGLTLLATVIWSILDRKRPHYRQLHTVLKIGLRYYLAMTMFSYGISKLFVLQMPYPSLAHFYTPLGEFTPMRFTWMYLGYSAPYQFFGGFMEVLGGVLILFRRSLLAGLLVLLGVMGNVLLLNLFYGVPVKLYSFFLVLIILYLLLEYRKQLINFFLNRPTVPISIKPYFDKNWQSYLRIGLKVVFILYTFGYTFYNDYDYFQQRKEATPIVIEGAFDVYSFNRNGETVLSPTDTTRWNRIVISSRTRPGSGYGHITRGTSHFQQVNFSLDSMMNLTVKPRFDTTLTFKGQVEPKGTDQFVWQGISGTDTLELVLNRNERPLTLDKRKFMWVMEQKDF
ncbi:MAG: hypothetical protein AAFU33_17590 [Bacteroidota bacterium]